MLEAKRYLSPFTSQSQYKFCLGAIPQFGGGVDLGGRVWYPVKLLHISYNVFAGTEMLSFTVYEPIAIQILLGGRPPIWPSGRPRGSVVVPRETPHISYNLFLEPKCYLSPCTSQSQYKFCMGDRPPNLERRGGVRETSVVLRESPSHWA